MQPESPKTSAQTLTTHFLCLALLEPQFNHMSHGSFEITANHSITGAKPTSPTPSDQRQTAWP
jgi:hypothetical protein